MSRMIELLASCSSTFSRADFRFFGAASCSFGFSSCDSAVSELGGVVGFGAGLRCLAEVWLAIWELGRSG